MSEPTDAALVAASLAGDVEAFGVLADRYGNSFARFATQMLGDRNDAEEALQNAFIRAYRSLPGCREPDRFGAWLHRIVVNECRRLGAARTTARRRLSGSLAELAGVAIAPEVDAEALREEILAALQLLSEEQREAFLLKYVEELSYEEMAELTGVGVSALKMRVSRACERLRALLQEVHR